MIPANLTSEFERFSLTLEHDETIYTIIHKHWGKVVWSYIRLCLLALLTIVATLIVIITNLSQEGRNTLPLFIIIVGIWYLTLATYGLSEWYSYRQSVVIITNQRLIDCEQVNFIIRRVQTIDMHEIQSCSGELTAGWGTVFRYGSIAINTVGDQPVLIQFIALPESVAHLIMRYHNQIAHQGRNIIHDKLPEPALIPENTELIAEPVLEEIGADQHFAIVTFEIPSEDLSVALRDIPAEIEPTISYIEPNDHFAVSLIVSTRALQKVMDELPDKGARRIAVTRGS